MQHVRIMRQLRVTEAPPMQGTPAALPLSATLHPVRAETASCAEPITVISEREGSLLPFDSSRRFRRNVVYNPVDTFYFVDNAERNLL